MEFIKNIKLLKHDRKNIVVLLQGRLISQLFSSVYSFGSSLLILDITGKGFAFAISLVISTLPRIFFSIFAGAISDKIDRKKMIVFSDLLSGLVLIIYTIILSVTNLSLVMSIYLFNFILSTISVFFSVSMSGAIPQLVDKDNISRINSLSQTISSISSILGPILGGILYSIVDFKCFVLLNAISFIFSGISELFLRLRPIEKAIKSNSNTKANSFNECITYFKDTQGLFILMIISTVLNFFLAVGFTIPMPYIVNQVFKMNPSEYGLLKAALVIGSLLGSIILSIYPLKRGIVRQYVRSNITIGIIYVIFAMLSIPSSGMNIHFRKYIFFIIFISISFCMILINIPLRTILQQNIPDNIRGKVLGFLNTILSIASPLANLFAGFLVDHIEAFYLPFISGIIIAILGTLVRCNKKIKIFQA